MGSGKDQGPCFVEGSGVGKRVCFVDKSGVRKKCCFVAGEEVLYPRYDLIMHGNHLNYLVPTSYYIVATALRLEQSILFLFLSKVGPQLSYLMPMPNQWPHKMLHSYTLLKGCLQQ